MQTAAELQLAGALSRSARAAGRHRRRAASVNAVLPVTASVPGGRTAEPGEHAAIDEERRSRSGDDRARAVERAAADRQLQRRERAVHGERASIHEREMTVLSVAPERMLRPAVALAHRQAVDRHRRAGENVMPGAQIDLEPAGRFCRPGVPSVLLGVKPVVPGPVSAPVLTRISVPDDHSAGGQQLARRRAGDRAVDGFDVRRSAGDQLIRAGGVGRGVGDAELIAGRGGRRRQILQRNAGAGSPCVPGGAVGEP